MEVVMLCKWGKRRSISNSYRPNLLSGLGKLLEKTILAHLHNEVDALVDNSDEKYGFCANHSTTHQLVRVVDYITVSFLHRDYKNKYI